MLKLYLGEIDKNNKNYCEYNDAWFDRNTDKIKFESIVLDIIKKIDNVDYAGNKRVFSKFLKDTAISVEELSTGCKTVINVYSFPNKIFTAVECGDNALQVLFNLKRGNIYLPYFVLPMAFINEIEVISDGFSQIIHNNKELETLLNKKYGW